MRKLLETTLQSLVDAQANAHIGAAAHERTDTRTTQHNGSRPKTVTTDMGDVTVKILKTRTGSFFPGVWSRADYRRGAARRDLRGQLKAQGSEFVRAHAGLAVIRRRTRSRGNCGPAPMCTYHLDYYVSAAQWHDNTRA
jgi:hypothetical protein